MSALGHVVFFWFHFQKQNEIKKKMKKNYKKNEVMKMNKIKTKLKQRQNEQNKKVQNLQQK